MQPTPATPPRPVVTATIEPQGRRDQVPRDYAIKVAFVLGGSADKSHVTLLARRAFEAFPPDDSGVDRRRFDELLGRATGKTPAATVGIEASTVWPGRPGDQRVEQLRAALAAEGYHVMLREIRECVEPGCLATATVGWNRDGEIPRGWYSSDVCGKHSYKSCPQCKSVFQMTSENSSDHAPSLHCEVCGGVLIEWGGSKVWSAQLVTRGTPPV